MDERGKGQKDCMIKLIMLKLDTVDCSIKGEERLIYIQLTKHRNFQNEGSAIQHSRLVSTGVRLTQWQSTTTASAGV